MAIQRWAAPCGALIIAIAGTIAAASAQDAGSADRGKQVFEQCAPCHSLDADVTIVGPSLHGLFGRPAASLDSFDYSNALYASGITWNAATVAKWVTGPSAMVPGTKMQFDGIGDPGAVADLIAYLQAATQ
jgi:cytochrome c